MRGLTIYGLLLPQWHIFLSLSVQDRWVRSRFGFGWAAPATLFANSRKPTFG